MSGLIFSLALLAQAVLPTVSEAQQSLAASEIRLGTCLQARAKLWSSLPDDASSIASGALYICKDFLDSNELEMQRLDLAVLMTNRQSANGLDAMLRQQIQDKYLRLKDATIAVVLNERYIKLKQAGIKERIN